jgi:uncharacterized protein (TIGR04255 family)
MLPRQLSLQTQRYTRWAPFRAAFSKIALPLAEDYTATVSTSAVQLEYVDRFLWTGTWEDFDVSQLIKSNPLISERATQAKQQWHCHTGWFDWPSPTLRRLTIANVDVVSAGPTPNLLRPSVGIQTSLQEGAFAGPEGDIVATMPDAEIIPRLDQQHLDLKELLRTIISDSTAKQIGL